MSVPDFIQIMDFVESMRWQDWVDIFLVAVIIYQAIRLVRGTRSMQMLLGVAIVLAAYWFSNNFELLTLNWILSIFLANIIIILAIIFQDDIRRALTQVAKMSFVRSSSERVSVVGEVVRASFLMASKRIGAIIAFEGNVGLKNYIEVGTILDAQVSDDLLLSIFNTASPLHDGAVVIQEGRIAAAACFLPLSPDEGISRFLGTRHRAAIGLTQETDAAVIVVSEERGVVSLVSSGKVTVMLDQNELRNSLTRLLHYRPSGPEPMETAAQT